MKWQYLLVVLLLLGCVASVGAISENFQSWGSSVMGGGSPPVVNSNSDAGTLALPEGLTEYPTYSPYIININPVIFSYAAWDGRTTNPGIANFCPQFVLEDSNHNVLVDQEVPGGSSSSYNRVEVNIVGMQPRYYLNGVYQSSSPVLNIYPSYLAIGQGNCGPYDTWVDNIVIGGSDPHVVGALPSNWTIIRDFINPLADGVYAWNPATSSWVLENSNSFYIDADTSSQQSATTEYFDIMYQGAIVNTTVIYPQTSPRNQIQYSVSQFVNSDLPGGGLVPDGEYTAEFRGYPQSAAYFWLTSNGAAVSWDKTSYPQSSTAIITYAITNSYYQPSTYTYSLAVVNTAGTTLQTYSLNSQTGTESLQLNPTTYPAGVYYAEVIATDSTGNKNIMNYAAMQVTGYSYISGYVMDAQAGTILPNATVNTTQGSATETEISNSNGSYTMTTGWLTGGALTVFTNKTGYTNDTRSFSPLAAGNIALNITLVSNNTTFSGAAIDGVVRDNQYGNPVTSATVNVYNTSTSESYITTTNIAGFYIVNNLVANRLYNITSAKSGYSPVSQPVQVTAVGV